MENPNNNNIQLILSRNSYPLNSSVIGTITVPASDDIASLQLYVAGRFRLDSRWHDDIPLIQKLYGSHPCHAEAIPKSVEQSVEDGYFQKPKISGGTRNTDASVCFWSTNVVTLYDKSSEPCIQVPLVQNGDPLEDESIPKPLKMRGSEWFQKASELLQMMQSDNIHEIQSIHDMNVLEHEVTLKDERWEKNNDVVYRDEPSLNDLILDHHNNPDSTEIHSSNDMEERQLHQLHFTFRADLPKDTPVTVHAVSARIFYSAVIYVVTKEGKNMVIQAPFTVTSSDDPINDYDTACISKTKISIGTLHSIAHTKRYLVDLSPTYKSEPRNIFLERRRPRIYPIQKVDIQDNGIPCCTLSIMGGGILSPGEFLHLKFTFSIGEKLMPCHQVSACLQGSEWVVSSNGERKKARSYLFDTDYVRVNPESTEMVSLKLQLPQDCPISISTGFLEIGMNCRIDLTVKESNQKRYRFLTVEFPCRVYQCEPGYEPMENDLSIEVENDLYQSKWWDESNKESVVLKNIVTAQVLNDLRILSLISISNVSNK